MIRRDLPAYAMIAVAIAALGLAVRGALVLAPLAVALGLHPWWRRTRPPTDPPAGLARVLPHLVIGAAVAVLATIWPVTDAGGDAMGGPFFVGYYALALALLKLYEKRTPGTAPQLVLCATTAHLCAAPALRWFLGRTRAWKGGFLGDAAPDPHALFLVLLAPHAILVAWLLADHARLARGNRGWRRPLQLASLLATIALTWAATQVLHRNYTELTRWVAELGGSFVSRQGRAGFADRARLGSVARRQHGEDQRVALRAYASTAPGYLRARVYHHYGPAQWEVDRRTVVKREVAQGRHAFVSHAGRTADILVYPTSAHRSSFFLPLRVGAVTTACDTVESHPARILRSLSQPTDRGYGVVLDREPIHDEHELPRNRGLPEDVRLLASIDRLIARARLRGLPPEQVVSRLASDFARRYTYRYGIRFRRDGPDPLVQFLESKRHGHCELFASAGVLALRRLDIPARYVTGYICKERNPIRKRLYIARDRHAHAWVEYYDPRRGWARAELTPPDGRPDTAEAEGRRAFGDWVGSLWLTVVELLRDGLPSLPGRLLTLMRSASGELLTSPWSLLIIGAGGLLWWLRQRPARRRAGHDWARRELTDGVAAARERYRELERALAAAGLARPPSETLHAYADRLASAASDEAWPASLDRQASLEQIRAFAWMRYGPEATAETPTRS